MPPGAAAMNAGAARARGAVLVFARRPIAAMENGWLREIVSHVVRPEVGAVAPGFGRRRETWKMAGSFSVWVESPRQLFAGFHGSTRVIQSRLAATKFFGRFRRVPCGAAVSLCRGGGFDAENLPHHFYDVDFCLRLGEKKLRMVWTPYANLTLSDSRAAANADVSQEAGYMQKRWGERLRRDPCYNPNLSLDPPGFTLAIAPHI